MHLVECETLNKDDVKEHQRSERKAAGTQCRRLEGTDLCLLDALLQALVLQEISALRIICTKWIFSRRTPAWNPTLLKVAEALPEKCKFKNFVSKAKTTYEKNATHLFPERMPLLIRISFQHAPTLWAPSWFIFRNFYCFIQTQVIWWKMFPCLTWINKDHEKIWSYWAVTSDLVEV